ncbi:MAG: hypothetical protein BAJALOKI3v1_130038 [Promethearchaeota archaeon]|nr:MAG: hypothetical protein BAJALOKI3v1_130038 [Candidatus Lokiarchaeota archaeon]
MINPAMKLMEWRHKPIFMYLFDIRQVVYRLNVFKEIMKFRRMPI